MKQAIAFLAMLLVPVCVFAADGQVLINQSIVMAAGGFPYVISQPGSYKLSGNLAATAGADAIHITASNVVLDLNGFSISSLGVGSGSPAGIQAIGTLSNISIHNGSMTGWTRGIDTISGGPATLVELVDLTLEENFTVGGLTTTNGLGIFANSNVLVKRVVTDGQVEVKCPAVVVDSIMNFLQRFGDLSRCTLANNSIGLVQ